MLKAFPGAKSFGMSKFICAYLLRTLRRCHGIHVATEAVAREIRFSKVSMVDRKGKEVVNHFLANYCHFTLVTHGVGFHVDQGKDNNTSFLENRMVFVCDRKGPNPELPEGRGYISPTKFWYALIDW